MATPASSAIAASVPTMTGRPNSAIRPTGNPIPMPSSYRQRQANTNGLGRAAVLNAYRRPARACLVLRGRGDGIMAISPSLYLAAPDLATRQAICLPRSACTAPRQIRMSLQRS